MSQAIYDLLCFLVHHALLIPLLVLTFNNTPSIATPSTPKVSDNMKWLGREGYRLTLILIMIYLFVTHGWREQKPKVAHNRYLTPPLVRRLKVNQIYIFYFAITFPLAKVMKKAKQSVNWKLWFFGGANWQFTIQFDWPSLGSYQVQPPDARLSSKCMA